MIFSSTYSLPRILFHVPEAEHLPGDENEQRTAGKRAEGEALLRGGRSHDHDRREEQGEPEGQFPARGCVEIRRG